MYNPGQELSSLSFDKIIGGALDAVIKAQNNSSMTTVNFVKSVGFVNDENGNPVKPICVDFKYPKEIRPFLPGRPARVFVKVENGGNGYSKETLSETYTADGETLNIEFEVNSDGAIVAANITNAPDAKKINPAVLTLAPKDGKTVAGTGAKLTLIVSEASESEAAVYQDMTLSVPILTMLPVPFIRVATTDIELNVKINSVNQTETSDITNSSANSSSSVGYKGWGANVNCTVNASISNQKQSSSKEEVKKEYSLNIKVHAVQDEMPSGLSRILDVLEESIVPKIEAPAAL